MQWRLDVVGPLPRALPQIRTIRFLLIATDYFTKWIEAVPLSEVTRQQIVKFHWQNIVCRFGLPPTIISDNGTNFASKHVANFCFKCKITHRFSTPATHKATARPRSTIAQSSIACARVWARRRANGWKNYLGCSGHTEPQSAFRRAKLHSP